MDMIWFATMEARLEVGHHISCCLRSGSCLEYVARLGAPLPSVGLPFL